jgi:hypothetical protein
MSGLALKHLKAMADVSRVYWTGTAAVIVAEGLVTAVFLPVPATSCLVWCATMKGPLPFCGAHLRTQSLIALYVSAPMKDRLAQIRHNQAAMTVRSQLDRE